MVDAPDELTGRVISLVDCLECEVDRTTVLIECLQQIDHRIRSIRLGDAMLLDHWRAYCMLTGRRVTIDIYEKRSPAFVRASIRPELFSFNRAMMSTAALVAL